MKKDINENVIQDGYTLVEQMNLVNITVPATGNYTYTFNANLNMLYDKIKEIIYPEFVVVTTQGGVAGVSEGLNVNTLEIDTNSVSKFGTVNPSSGGVTYDFNGTTFKTQFLNSLSFKINNPNATDKIVTIQLNYFIKKF